MAGKGGKTTTTLGRDSISKRLGVKIFGGQLANIGNIIIRQRGATFKPGKNTRLGKDFTIYSLVKGVVRFQTKKIRSFNGRTKTVKFVNVEPVA